MSLPQKKTFSFKFGNVGAANNDPYQNMFEFGAANKHVKTLALTTGRVIQELNSGKETLPETKATNDVLNMFQKENGTDFDFSLDESVRIPRWNPVTILQQGEEMDIPSFLKRFETEANRSNEVYNFMYNCTLTLATDKTMRFSYHDFVHNEKVRNTLVLHVARNVVAAFHADIVAEIFNSVDETQYGEKLFDADEFDGFFFIESENLPYHDDGIFPNIFGIDACFMPNLQLFFFGGEPEHASLLKTGKILFTSKFNPDDYDEKRKLYEKVKVSRASMTFVQIDGEVVCFGMWHAKNPMDTNIDWPLECGNILVKFNQACKTIAEKNGYDNCHVLLYADTNIEDGKIPIFKKDQNLCCFNEYKNEKASVSKTVMRTRTLAGSDQIKKCKGKHLGIGPVDNGCKDVFVASRDFFSVWEVVTSVDFSKASATPGKDYPLDHKLLTLKMKKRLLTEKTSIGLKDMSGRSFMSMLAILICSMFFSAFLFAVGFYAGYHDVEALDLFMKDEDDIFDAEDFA